MLNKSGKALPSRPVREGATYRRGRIDLIDFYRKLTPREIAALRIRAAGLTMAWNARPVLISEKASGLGMPSPFSPPASAGVRLRDALQICVAAFINQKHETNMHATRLNLTSSSLFPYNSGKKKKVSSTSNEVKTFQYSWSPMWP